MLAGSLLYLFATDSPLLGASKKDDFADWWTPPNFLTFASKSALLYFDSTKSSLNAGCMSKAVVLRSHFASNLVIIALSLSDAFANSIPTIAYEPFEVGSRDIS